MKSPIAAATCAVVLASLSACATTTPHHPPRPTSPALPRRATFDGDEVAAAQVGEMDSAWSDLRAAPATIGRDFVDVYSTKATWAALVGGYLGAELMDRSGVEPSVTSFFADHSLYSDSTSRVFDELGQGYVLLAGAGAWYLWARRAEDAEALAASKHLARSLVVTGLSTLALKAAFNDERPNGGSGGYPSGHASMSVAAATSLWLTQGPEVGVPAAVLSSLVILQRLDSRAHELDDVIAGAALGWAVAYSLGRDERVTVFGGEVAPTLGPQGSPALSLSWHF